MPIMAGQGRLKLYVGEYSFAIDGGAGGTITLRSNSGPIPNGSVVVEAFMDITGGFTTGTSATAALQVNAANDLVTATIVSSAPWSTTGLKATVPVFTAASMIKLTADRSPALVIGTGTVTAGIMRVHIFYV